MVNEKILRKYIEGELYGEELINFEDEINISASLKREIDNYKNTVNNFKSLINVKADEEYFVNILPRFNERPAEQSKPLFRPSFATGGLLIALAAVILFLIINNNHQTEQITFQSLNNDEINEYLNDYTYDISASQLIEDIPESYDSLINTMIESEFSFNYYREDYFAETSNGEYLNLLDELSNEEIEGIYNSLIKEDFN